MTIDPKSDTRNLIDAYKGMSVEAIKDDLDTKRFEFHVAIENWQHDFNIGTIVRNANAFNANTVHIIGKRHWNRRGAMVTDRYLTIMNHSSVEEFAEWARVNQLNVIGIDNIPGSVNLASATLPKSCVFVLGQEGPGLSPHMQVICEQIIAIEQFGSTRSVNVGVASGIIMYAWLQQHVLNQNAP